ncbi:beta-ketoacyl-ACP synthase [Haliea sp. E1-2-M8]|uniref:beta-ketoacyl-ACP synthase n=1 Tax=Haliea sp. E1-2-M8 TaxID=3064706 RepID=UPI00271FD3BC|nr:beta-ketoacyl-ACP synthase [Haliea sp. E1-2-M8]MDO8861128.1 beta-ketoacyl-ACP synthase [Haliea sp. E1-2-M8]
MSSVTPVFLNHAGAICSLGADLASVEDNLFPSEQLTPGSEGNFLTLSDAWSPGRTLPLGLVTGHLPSTVIAAENTRNNRLLAASLSPLYGVVEGLKSRHGRHRIGIVVGTSTSGIAEGEAALTCDSAGARLVPGYRYTSQELSAPTRFLARCLDVSGPCWTQSSACTSGAKALASAARLLRLGVCDAVVAAGVDSLCHMTVAGFSSLLVTAESHCNPFSRNRCGINIGEASAVFVLSREPGPVRLAGVGESSDAYHISSPDPEGKGAAAAMLQALSMAQTDPAQIDYVNLHGTATPQNDAMEALAVNRVFGPDVPCGSTKPLTGHTLAAAGAIEALVCWLLLQRDDNRLPPHLWDGEVDPDLAALNGLARSNGVAPARMVMSNSFAFGGNNLSLVLSRE